MNYLNNGYDLLGSVTVNAFNSSVKYCGSMSGQEKSIESNNMVERKTTHYKYT